MKIDTIIVGHLQVNCYIVYDEKSLEGIVIDPGDEPEKIISALKPKKLKVKYILCTHAHFDHIGGISALKGETTAKIALNRNDIELYAKAKDQAALWGFGAEGQPEPDMFIGEGDVLSVGDLSFRVLSTPGHSPGGISMYGHGVVFTGDTVFEGSVGRTDLYGGDVEALKRSFKRILSLPPETRILPGHGPSTTVKDELQFNFFVHEL